MTNLKELGRGPRGRTYRVKYENGETFARKDTIVSRSLQQNASLWINCMKEIWKPLTHDNVTKLMDARQEADHGQGGNYFTIHTCMEYARHGSIKSLYEKRKDKGKRLTEPEIQGYARDMAKGLDYIHEKGLVHGNLKCSNILLFDAGATQHAKISDLSSAARVGGSIPEECRRLPFVAPLEETSYWSPPEAIKQDTYTSSKAADVYRFGATMLEMCTGEHPFPELNQKEALGKIQGGVVPSLPLNSDTFHAGDCARDLIKKCLRANPEERPTTKDILCDPFITGKGHKENHENNMVLSSSLQLKAPLGIEWPRKEPDKKPGLVMSYNMECANNGSTKLFCEHRKDKKERLTELEIQGYARDLANELDHIHEKGLVVGNFNCSNILLVGDGDGQHAKISDLTSGMKAGSSNSNSEELNNLWRWVWGWGWDRLKRFFKRMWTLPVQGGWKAIKQDTYTSSKAADVYRFGATLVEMYTGEHPSPDLNQDEALSLHAGPCARELIEKCLRTNSGERPTTKDILKDNFIRGMLDGTCHGNYVPDFLGRVSADCKHATVIDGADVKG